MVFVLQKREVWGKAPSMQEMMAPGLREEGLAEERRTVLDWRER